MPADFRPTASWDNLRLRASLLQQTRQFFDQRGFLEVETPLLSRDTVIDRHLDPLAVTLFRDARTPQSCDALWLQTSPEFGMKRLLAAGAPSIYQICKAFRGGDERGPQHNPEFTLLEWYAVGQDYAAGMDFLDELAQQLITRGVAERLSYGEAFQRYANIDPHSASLTDLVHCCSDLLRDDTAALNAERHLLLDLLLTRIVEPQLGRVAPTILYDYPADQAALAQVRIGEPPLAERFELYVDGIELANGYHELLDAEVLHQRNAENNLLRAADGKHALPTESRLLAAMEHGLPICTGCALGFDRLVMIAAGASDIGDALTFPIERA